MDIEEAAAEGLPLSTGARLVGSKKASVSSILLAKRCDTLLATCRMRSSLQVVLCRTCDRDTVWDLGQSRLAHVGATGDPLPPAESLLPPVLLPVIVPGCRRRPQRCLPAAAARAACRLPRARCGSALRRPRPARRPLACLPSWPASRCPWSSWPCSQSASPCCSSHSSSPPGC